MRTRKLLAVAVVAALPLLVGTLHAPPPGSTANTRPVAERPSAPQWLHSIGFDWGWRWASAYVYAGGNPMSAYALAA